MKLKINNISVGYGQKTVLTNINLQAKSGDFIALIGKNGAGKSTFLKTLSGILPVMVGEVLLDDINLLALSVRERARYVGIVLTDRIDVPLTVREFLALGRQPYTNLLGKISGKDQQVIDEVSDVLKITDFFDRKITELSDGERQKVLIGRALVQETPVLLLDEPTTHLDMENKAVLINSLQKISKRQNKIIIISTHDINLILPKINKIWTTNKSINEILQRSDMHKMFQSDLIKYDADCQIFRLV